MPSSREGGTYRGARIRPVVKTPDFAQSSETPGGYVGAPVLKEIGILTRRVSSQCLEGSRFDV